jgi:hypothetical protein
VALDSSRRIGFETSLVRVSNSGSQYFTLIVRPDCMYDRSNILRCVSVAAVIEQLSTGLDTLTSPLITMGVSTEVCEKPNAPDCGSPL